MKCLSLIILVCLGISSAAVAGGHVAPDSETETSSGDTATRNVNITKLQGRTALRKEEIPLTEPCFALPPFDAEKQVTCEKHETKYTCESSYLYRKNQRIRVLYFDSLGALAHKDEMVKSTQGYFSHKYTKGLRSYFEAELEVEMKQFKEKAKKNFQLYWDAFIQTLKAFECKQTRAD